MSAAQECCRVTIADLGKNPKSRRTDSLVVFQMGNLQISLARLRLIIV